MPLFVISATKVHQVSIGNDVDVQLLLGVFVYYCSLAVSAGFPLLWMNVMIIN